MTGMDGITIFGILFVIGCMVVIAVRGIENK